MLVDVVMGEVAKTVTASVASAGMAGAGRLLRLVRNKVDQQRLPVGAPENLDELRELLVRCAGEDPEWGEQLARELAESVPAALDAEVNVAFVPPVPFCDRDSLRSGLPDSGVRGFAGPRGSGKSALVQQLAADRVARFGVHRAVVDLDDFRVGDVVRLAEAKRHVLRQLGVAEVVVGEPELGQQYVRVLVRRPVLLVVENVLAADEVTALVVDGPAATTLVTTRRLTRDLRASVPRWSELGGLDEPGALAMLASCCPDSLVAAEPGNATELVRRFGCQPHAIRVLGGILSLRVGEVKPIAGLLAEFDVAGIGETDDLLGAALTGQVADVPASARDGFRLLALCPAGEFTIATAEIMVGRSARRDVERLRELGLVEVIGPGRFRMSWSVRRFAAELGAVENAEEALDRLMKYYAGRAVAADLAGGQRMRYYRVPDGVSDWPADEDRVAWLDAEAEVLGALVDRAYLHGHDDEVGQLCGGIEVLSLHKGRYELCLAAYERGAQAANRQGEPKLLARQHALCGRAATLLHRFDRARVELDAARAAAARLVEPALTASIWEFTGRLAEEQARGLPAPNWRGAIDSFANAVRIDRAYGDAGRRALGLHSRMLAGVLIDDGRATEALPLLDEALACTVAGDDRNAARVYTVQAKARMRLGELPAARTALGRAQELVQASGASQYQVELADLTAEIEFRAGNIGQARSGWAALAQACLQDGHPRAAEYFAKLSWLPPLAP